MIFGDDADIIFRVTPPKTLLVPIFELHCGEGGLPIEEQIQERLEALLDIAKFELCTNDTEPAGAFYGLIRAHHRVRGTTDGPYTEVVELGLAFSEGVLIPQFADDPMGFFYYRMESQECERVGLPQTEVPRPTRFEREYVI